MVNSSLIIPKKKDGEVWNETIPFNPLLMGWEFVKACCCEADFVKGDLKMKIAVKKDRLKVFDSEKNVILVYRVPKSQYEFYVLVNTL